MTERTLVFLLLQIFWPKRICALIDGDEAEDDMISDGDSSDDENIDEINELESGGDNCVYNVHV